ncbi:MAG: ureidoglycolate lyase [Chitinophagaceae bacterium]|nr:ureidoglycolate lyase [Polaromonas sp.]
MPTHLHPEPLTPKAFAAYGTVVAPFAHEQPPAGARAINGGTTWRLDLLADLDLHQGGGTPGLAVYSAIARRFPLALQEMERHTQGSQSFLPLGNARFVVVVAPAGAAPQASDVKAFITNGLQGVVLHPGTWHHGLVAVEAGCFAVVERHAAPGAAADCDEVALAPTVWLVLA